MVGFDDEVVVFDAGIGAVLAVGGYGDHSPIGFENGPGEIAGFATYGVEDNVDVADSVMETGVFVVDDFVCPEAFDESDIWS